MTVLLMLDKTKNTFAKIWFNKGKEENKTEGNKSWQFVTTKFWNTKPTVIPVILIVLILTIYIYYFLKKK
jgi:hypothetical protein